MSSSTEIAVYLPDEAATLALGAKLASVLQAGDMVALFGDLGAGKTTFVRGLVNALSPEPQDVVSPTFTFVQMYELPAGLLWHFDLYRLETPEALVELGWDETVDGIALVEWPERAGNALPKVRLDLTLSIEGSGRAAKMVPHSEDWEQRLEHVFSEH